MSFNSDLHRLREAALMPRHVLAAMVPGWTAHMVAQLELGDVEPTREQYDTIVLRWPSLSASMGRPGPSTPFTPSVPTVVVTERARAARIRALVRQLLSFSEINRRRFFIAMVGFKTSDATNTELEEALGLI